MSEYELFDAPGARFYLYVERDGERYALASRHFRIGGPDFLRLAGMEHPPMLFDKRWMAEMHRHYLAWPGVEIGQWLRAASADPTNAKARAVVERADGLGHPPTGKEFQAWFEARGGTLTDASGDVEEYAN